LAHKEFRIARKIRLSIRMLVPSNVVTEKSRPRVLELYKREERGKKYNAHFISRAIGGEILDAGIYFIWPISRLMTCYVHARTRTHRREISS